MFRRRTASPIVKNQHPSVNSTNTFFSNRNRFFRQLGEITVFFRQSDEISRFFPFLSGSSRTAGQKSVDGRTGYSLKYGQKDVPQIWPNYALLDTFLCQNFKKGQIWDIFLLVRLVVIFVVGMICIFATFAAVTGRMNSLRFESHQRSYLQPVYIQRD